MKRFRSIIAGLIGLVASSDAIAATPYTMNWVLVEENPDCETAALLHYNGTAFLNVNNTPIPTYEIPGAFTVLSNGWESNRAEASFDSVLMRIGANVFRFNVANSGGADWCVQSSNVVTLNAPTLGIEKLLFNVRREGTKFSGSTNLDLKLEEINPQLAQDIAILEEELANERKWLVANANKIPELDARQDALQQLETELGDLLKRPLDEISADDLDEMLKRYSSIINDATREALQEVLADLKQSIYDLRLTPQPPLPVASRRGEGEPEKPRGSFPPLRRVLRGGEGVRG